MQNSGGSALQAEGTANRKARVGIRREKVSVAEAQGAGESSRGGGRARNGAMPQAVTRTVNT